MKKLFLIAIFFVAFALSADQTLFTNDDKQVLLKDDGTWQYIEHPELVAHFQGSGSKDTDSFKITKKPWRLKWKAQGAIFSLFVKTEEGDLVTGVSGNEDQSFVRQTGLFYLEITAIGPYEIWVLQ